MTRLADARAALDALDGMAPAGAERAEAVIVLEDALKRMAQLEKVAELARAAAHPGLRPDGPGQLLLQLALVELDSHPDTREQRPAAVPQEILERQEPNVVASAERAHRMAWPTWRDQRGPSVTETP